MEEDTRSNDQEKQSIEAELCKLREALRDAEERMKTREEERQQALQKLQTSTEVRLHSCSCLLIPYFIGYIFVLMFPEPESAVEANKRNEPEV